MIDVSSQSSRASSNIYWMRLLHKQYIPLTKDVVK